MPHKSDFPPLLEREQSKELGKAEIARQTAKYRVERGRSQQLGEFFCWRQVVSAIVLITFGERLAPLFAWVMTALKASRGRYPAGIGVNRVITWDERH